MLTKLYMSCFIYMSTLEILPAQEQFDRERLFVEIELDDLHLSATSCLPSSPACATS